MGGGGQLTGAAVALGGLFRHAPGDHRIQRRRHPAGTQLAGLRRGRRQMRTDHPFDGFGAIRRRPGQTLAQHAGQRIDIGARGDLVAGEPLGGHVVVGPHRHPGLGQPRVRLGAGDAEIHQVGEVVPGDQDVFRLHIAMGHPGGVRGIQRGGDLTHDGHRPRRAQRSVPLQQRRQIGAVDQPHIQIQQPTDLAVIVDRHHMRFGQPPRRVGLPLHPRPKHRIPRELLGDQLQRHHPALAGVLGLIDLTHAAATQQPQQPIRPELRPDPRPSPGVAHRRRSLRLPPDPANPLLPQYATAARHISWAPVSPPDRYRGRRHTRFRPCPPPRPAGC
ncbi:hypothetical protein C1Y40_05487 [Mycobacterium talmoniae]|uniref:Uncharacterized protein n=1 Tax=Mycobacterium talmoniae TaxID=1858794 RepID=A0A2S8BCI8_9MYCO|nr:hypothetical protein C1Y40_05487 [Mycobacterium talmoniae]